MQYKYESIKCEYSCYISKNINIQPHFHYQLEFLFIIEGELSISIHNRTYQLKKNDIALIFPNQIHYANCEKDCRIFCFIFRPSFIGDMKNVLTDYHIIKSCFSLSILCDLSHSIINKLINLKEISNEKSESNDYFRYNAYRSMIMFLISDIISKSDLVSSDIQKNYTSLLLILDYIDEHFSDELTLSILSKKLGINRTHISRLFSKNIHISFPDYINQRRLDAAQLLIIRTDLSIKEIMYHCGYQSERTFYRCFKNMYGITPLQLRHSSTRLFSAKESKSNTYTRYNKSGNDT